MYTWVVITDGVFGKQVQEFDIRTEALDEYDRQRADEYNDSVIIAQVLAAKRS